MHPGPEVVLLRAQGQRRAKVLEERNFVIAAIDECLSKVRQLSEFDRYRLKISSPCSRTSRAIKGPCGGASIAVLRDRATGARTRVLKDVMAEIMRPRASEPAGAGEPTVLPPIEETFRQGRISSFAGSGHIWRASRRRCHFESNNKPSWPRSGKVGR